MVLQAKYQDPLHPALVDPLLALADVELKQSDTASWQRYHSLPSRQSTTCQTASTANCFRQSITYQTASSTNSSRQSTTFQAASTTLLVDSLVCFLHHFMCSLNM